MRQFASVILLTFFLYNMSFAQRSSFIDFSSVEERLDSVISSDFNRVYYYLYDDSNIPVGKIIKAQMGPVFNSISYPYEYDSNNLLSKLNLYFVENNDTIGGISSFNYDNQGIRIEQLTSHFNNNVLTPEYLYKTEYLTNKVVYVVKNWEDGGWNGHQDSLVYYISDNLIDSMIHIDNTGGHVWLNVSSYDKTSRSGSILFKNHGIEKYVTDFQYGEDFQMSSLITYFDVDRLSPKEKVVRTYDDYGNLTLQIDSTYNTVTNTWVFHKKYEYQFDYSIALAKVARVDFEYTPEFPDFGLSPDLPLDNPVFKSKIKSIKVSTDSNYDKYDFYYSKVDKTSTVIQVYEADNIEIYPNPVQDVIRIEGGKELGSGPVNFAIYDQSGKLLTCDKLQDSQINVSSLKAGNYYLVIYYENNVFGKSFVKQ